MQYSKVMGIDYGDARIGVALSDLMQITANPFEVFENKGIQDCVNHLCKLINDNMVSTVVFGLPINMDGTEGDRAIVTREVADELSKHSKVKIVFQDERLTSLEADEILKSSKLTWQERKKLIDKVSAALILESYLNRKEK
ncbi:MAG: Holliday junction resolvase RuvX [Clostridia bacterium]|nr:Holliday junction resolvase RuvX [Clostridia bacterium]